MPKTRKKPSKNSPSSTGKYVIDPETGELVKISDRTPKVASRGSASPAQGPCGNPMPPGGCGGGPCGI
jgi:hypothetical protein